MEVTARGAIVVLMKTLVIAIAGVAALSTVIALLVATGGEQRRARPRVAEQSATATASARATEGGLSRETVAAPTHPNSVPAATALPILTGPLPFDATPLRSMLHSEVPRPAELPRVREVAAAAAYRESAVSATGADARIEAINKLALIGGPSDVPALNQIIGSDPDVGAREAAHHATQIIQSRFAGQDWK